ncbi:uncharacterized protein F5891DRAFT_1184414 [Suillus fuscotomentosus]|uniref:Uncharacterized protein n=1 Tax=Suillus fuscotomentosus TaxID=1912939 RepID=A0AAD4EDN5_9AGAM|nr:uncharacterized protein F5891DRAFT_1184414 [Suillus fuscotomentosus]KAG1904222.1 hypothetical protein F5891DRAFT_1184414 [Suillus fuscotomentosus]
MEGPNNSRGLLINWEFAVFITSNVKYSIGGTGTIPFMSCALLAQMAELQAKATQQEARKSSSKTLVFPPSWVSQSFGDDLESLFFTFSPISVSNSWSNLNLDVCKLRKVYFFAVSSEEAHLEKQFHPYFAKLIPLAKEWRAILKDNMEARVTFDSIIDLLEHHITTLEDDEERTSTNENLKKSAAEITKCLKKRQAEGGSMEPESVPQLAKHKKHETADGDSASEVTQATMDSDGLD